MYKIYLYELRRTVLNKFFFGLLAVTLFVGWQALTTVIIKGVAHTAPFSAWSFGSYLAQILPLLTIALLFLVHGMFSSKAQRTAVLTSATPVCPKTHLITKCLAVASAWLILAAAAVALCLCFLVALFGPAVRPAEWLVPLVILLLPTFLFVLGAGLLAGQAHHIMIFALMPLAVLLGALPLPPAVQLFGDGYFASYALSLNSADPPFQLSAEMLAGRIGYFLLGAILICIAVFMTGRKKKIWQTYYRQK